MNKIKYLPVNQIKTFPFNPKERVVMDDEMRELICAIQKRLEQGLHPLPETETILIGKDGVLGDGHRRLFAMQYCGLGNVPVLIDDERTGIEIWRDRASAKPMTGSVIAKAMQLGLDIEHLPVKTKKKQSRYCKRWSAVRESS